MKTNFCLHLQNSGVNPTSQKLFYFFLDQFAPPNRALLHGIILRFPCWAARSTRITKYTIPAESTHNLPRHHERRQRRPRDEQHALACETRIKARPAPKRNTMTSATTSQPPAPAAIALGPRPTISARTTRMGQAAKSQEMMPVMFNAEARHPLEGDSLTSYLACSAFNCSSIFLFNSGSWLCSNARLKSRMALRLSFFSSRPAPGCKKLRLDRAGAGWPGQNRPGRGQRRPCWYKQCRD